MTLGRLILAFRGFFAILLHGTLSGEILESLGIRRPTPAPAAAAAPLIRMSDGALGLLAILQRDSRLVDFLMEDISAYEDAQIGAAVRTLHDQCRDSLLRYVELTPVIDSVEGTFTNLASDSRFRNDPSLVKFIGNVPATTPNGGVLRHKGWRARKADLPALNPRQDITVIAPAEIEIE